MSRCGVAPSRCQWPWFLGDAASLPSVPCLPDQALSRLPNPTPPHPPGHPGRCSWPRGASLRSTMSRTTITCSCWTPTTCFGASGGGASLHEQGRLACCAPPTSRHSNRQPMGRRTVACTSTPVFPDTLPPLQGQCGPGGPRGGLWRLVSSCVQAWPPWFVLALGCYAAAHLAPCSCRAVSGPRPVM